MPYVGQVQLAVALRHAVSRHGSSAGDLGSRRIAVSVTGTIQINDEGFRRRRIDRVVVEPELAFAFVDAILTGDDVSAVDDFEEAFAYGYGVGYVTVSDVTQLEICEAPP